jgi:hypothetical protein
MKTAETTITRRTYAAGLTLAAAIRAQNTPAPPIGQPHRYERIRRLGQLNITEKDTPDVDRSIRYSSSFKVDGLIVSAGGILGFHPTEVPYHKRSRHMGDRGLYGDYAAAARRAGIRVIDRLDPTYAFPEFFEALPKGFHAGTVKLLSAKKDLPFHHGDSEIGFRVPQVGEYEVLPLRGLEFLMHRREMPCLAPPPFTLLLH